MIPRHAANVPAVEAEAAEKAREGHDPSRSTNKVVSIVYGPGLCGSLNGSVFTDRTTYERREPLSVGTNTTDPMMPGRSFDGAT